MLPNSEMKTQQEHRLRTKIGIAENQFGFMARRSTIEFIYLL